MQPDGVESSNVDLDQEFVSLIITQHSQTANVTVFETDEEMGKSLVDILA